MEGRSWKERASIPTSHPGRQDFLHGIISGIRRESEECDGAADFLMLHSLGGGSGSGLGSRLLEHLRDKYPLHNIATVSVAPRIAGEMQLRMPDPCSLFSCGILKLLRFHRGFAHAEHQQRHGPQLPAGRCLKAFTGWCGPLTTANAFHGKSECLKAVPDYPVLRRMLISYCCSTIKRCSMPQVRGQRSGAQQACWMSTATSRGARSGHCGH